MNHKTFKEFLLESKFREFKGWWKIGESEPRKIWSTDFENDLGIEFDEEIETEHYEVIKRLDKYIGKKFLKTSEDDFENIIEYALMLGWIRFGQVDESIHGSHTFIHYNDDNNIKTYYTILKIIDWLGLSRNDEIALSGNPGSVIKNYDLEKVISVSDAKNILNRKIKNLRFGVAEF